MSERKKLDMKKISTRKRSIISSSAALKDVTPISWSKNIVSGSKKVEIRKYEASN